MMNDDGCLDLGCERNAWNLTQTSWNNSTGFNQTLYWNNTMNGTTANIIEQQPVNYWETVEADVRTKIASQLGRYVLLPIVLLGSFGNLLSLCVMSSRTMRASSTAFYMSVLAIADTVVLWVGCLRRWVIEVWKVDLLNVSPAACQIVNFLQYFSFDFAVWILVAMTIDRVIVVTNPLKAYRLATRKRASISLITLAVLFIGLNLHFFFTIQIEIRNGQSYCTGKTEFLKPFYLEIWPWIDATVYSFVPFALLLIMNVIIIVSLAKANHRKRQLTQSSFVQRRNDEQRNTINPRKLTTMLLSVTIAFMVLTAPGVVLHGVRETGEPFFDLKNPADMAKYILTRQIVRILLYLNHSINFLLYCITGEKFRRELVRMFTCRSANKYRAPQTSVRSIALSQTGTSNQAFNRPMSTASD